MQKEPDTDSPTTTSGLVFVMTVPVTDPLYAYPCRLQYAFGEERDVVIEIVVDVVEPRCDQVIVPVAEPSKVLPGRVPPPAAFVPERQALSVTAPVVVPLTKRHAMPAGGGGPLTTISFDGDDAGPVPAELVAVTVKV
jgi:hypothetical protein